MLATWLLRLYPRAWRERYESEVAAVLEQHRVTLKTSVDLLLSALDAQLDPAYRGEGHFRPMDSVTRLRSSNSTILWAFPVMMLSYFIFLSDLGDFLDGMIRQGMLRQNLVFSGIGGAMSKVSNIQLIALLAAALLLAGAVAFQAGASSLRYLKFVPLACVLIPTGILLFFWNCAFGFAAGEACSGPAFAGGWGRLAYPPLLLSFLVVAFAVARSQPSGRVLKIAAPLLGLVALGMALQMVEAVGWGLVAWHVDQSMVIQIAHSSNTKLWPGDWHIWLVLGLALVVLCGGMAIRATWRGLFTLLATRRSSN